jgi:hypothetical protein
MQNPVSCCVAWTDTMFVCCLTSEGTWAELLDPVLQAMLLQEADHTPFTCTAQQQTGSD